MKYRRWFALVIILCMTLPLAACGLKPAAPWPTLRENESCAREGRSLVRGNGNVVEKKTPLPEDERGYALRVMGISLRGSEGDIELVIDESLPCEVVLTADENIAARISVEYNAGAGEIVIDLKQRVVFTPTKLTIVVGGPVRALDLNGAWRFTYDCPSVTACEASVNGAANGKFTFGALDALRVSVNGASDIRLAGTAKRADLTINGAANIKAFDLAAVSAGVTINGAGGCEITATGTLDAEINGVGKVVYGGEPAVSRRVHGLGEVRAR
jgi:hypothetical protein